MFCVVTKFLLNILPPGIREQTQEDLNTPVLCSPPEQHTACGKVEGHELQQRSPAKKQGNKFPHNQVSSYHSLPSSSSGQSYTMVFWHGALLLLKLVAKAVGKQNYKVFSSKIEK